MAITKTQNMGMSRGAKIQIIDIVVNSQRSDILLAIRGIQARLDAHRMFHSELDYQPPRKANHIQTTTC
jgi:hypothetical protein